MAQPTATLHKNTDGTYTVKVYHNRPGVVSEVHFSNAAYASKLATQYFDFLTSIPEVAAEPEVVPSTLTTDSYTVESPVTEATTVSGVDITPDGDQTTVAVQGFTTDEQQGTSPVTIQSSSEEEVTPIGEKVEDTPVPQEPETEPNPEYESPASSEEVSSETTEPSTGPTEESAAQEQQGTNEMGSSKRRRK